MHIPRYILSISEETETLKILKEIGVRFTVTEDFIIANCATRGPLNEGEVLSKIFESSRPFATQDAMAKQYAIRAMSRMVPLINKAKEPHEKLAAISAINSLYPLSSDIALRLINMVGA